MEALMKINNIKEACSKYVLNFDGEIYETNDERSIIQGMDKTYLESNDNNILLEKRIYLAKKILLYSIMLNLKVEIHNSNEKLEENYKVDKDNSGNEVYYEEPDIILNVEDEISMFKGINSTSFASVYKKNNCGEYELI